MMALNFGHQCKVRRKDVRQFTSDFHSADRRHRTGRTVAASSAVVSNTRQISQHSTGGGARATARSHNAGVTHRLV